MDLSNPITRPPIIWSSDREFRERCRGSLKISTEEKNPRPAPKPVKEKDRNWRISEYRF